MSAIDLLLVVLVVGALFLLTFRLKPRTTNIVFLAIVTVLIIGLIYLSKFTMALLDVILFLVVVVALLIVLFLRNLYKGR